MRAIAQWEQFRGEAPLKSWLFAIMRNQFYQTTRSRARWQTVSADLARLSGGEAAPASLDPLFLSHLSGALGALTPSQREVLFLTAVEGLTYAEIADLTGSPIGTVMSRLSRARARLRELTDGL